MPEKWESKEGVLTNICHSINRWQEEQRIFTWGKDESEYEVFVKEAEANGRRLKVRLKRPSLSASEVAVCEEDPLRNLYISAEGEVSPCVYLYPPSGLLLRGSSAERKSGSNGSVLEIFLESPSPQFGTGVTTCASGGFS